jgi:hypothetical protein
VGAWTAVGAAVGGTGVGVAAALQARADTATRTPTPKTQVFRQFKVLINSTMNGKVRALGELILTQALFMSFHPRGWVIYLIKLGQLLVSHVGEDIRLAQCVFHSTNQSSQSVLIAPAQNIRHGLVDLHANFRLLKY